jgi:propanol-preferring alcohol dehydrogenase
MLTEYGRPLVVGELADPVATPDGVVLQVDACGICGSDVHAWRGDWRWRMELPLPHVLGHEVAGTVVELGDAVEGFAVGDRVTVPFHLDCGTCAQCADGRSNLCLNYQAIGFGPPGGWAERIAIPAAARNLVPLPRGIDAVSASMLGCRFSSAWHGLVTVAALKPVDAVTVFGLGGVGLACVAIATGIGASVVGVDPNAANRALAEAMGATVKESGAGLEPDSATLTVDAVGAQGVIDQSVGSLARGGRHLQLGLCGEEEGHQALPVDVLVKRELRVLGSVGCPRADWETLLAAVASGEVAMDRMPRELVTLEGISTVLDAMAKGEQQGMAVLQPSTS